MSLEAKLDSLLLKHRELNDTLSQPDKINSDVFMRMSKEYSDLTPIIEKIQTYRKAQAELQDLTVMVADPDCDAEMKGVAEEEIYELKGRLPELLKDVQIALLPRDEADEKNAILEVRAGTGGEEAA
jgi:peptide chain release factor 1